MKHLSTLLVIFFLSAFVGCGDSDAPPAAEELAPVTTTSGEAQSRSCLPGGAYTDFGGGLCSRPPAVCCPHAQPECCSGIARYVCLANGEDLLERCQ